MHPDQAIIEVDQTCADAALPRARHVVLQTAVETIRQIVAEHRALSQMTENQSTKIATLQKQVEDLQKQVEDLTPKVETDEAETT